MTMAGVFAKADVSDQRQRQLLGPKETQRFRHRSAFVGGAVSILVLVIGDTEKEHATDALRRKPVRFRHSEVGTQSCVALERGDLLAPVPPRDDEERRH